MTKPLPKVHDNIKEIQIIGTLSQEIINTLNMELPPTDILMPPGFIKHIKKRHNNTFVKYFKKIPEILKYPDYVGTNPSEPNSIELVKIFYNVVLIAIKLDAKGDLYLSSMYELNPSKIPRRISSGRLKPLK